MIGICQGCLSKNRVLQPFFYRVKNGNTSYFRKHFIVLCIDCYFMGFVTRFGKMRDIYPCRQEIIPEKTFRERNFAPPIDDVYKKV